MNEVKTKVASILKSDTTLRSLLSKSAEPWGVYFQRPPATPSFPLVTFSIIGGGVGEGTPDCQVRDLALRVFAYSKTNTDLIMERVKKLLHLSCDFTGLTTCTVRNVFLEIYDGDAWDPEFQVYVRMQQYRIFFNKVIS